jgi:hypothetical protein
LHDALLDSYPYHSLKAPLQGLNSQMVLLSGRSERINTALDTVLAEVDRVTSAQLERWARWLGILLGHNIFYPLSRKKFVQERRKRHSQPGFVQTTPGDGLSSLVFQNKPFLPAFGVVQTSITVAFLIGVNKTMNQGLEPKQICYASLYLLSGNDSANEEHSTSGPCRWYVRFAASATFIFRLSADYPSV